MGSVTFHFAGEGTTTWFDFAREIFRQADLRGLPRVPRLSPIQSTDYNSAALRPRNSVLGTEKFASVYGLTTRAWQDALSDTMDALIGPVRVHGVKR